MIGEDVLYLTVRELGERIRTHKLSPVELTEAYLDRSEKVGARLNAYATLTRDRAISEARAAEKEIAAGKYRGPLHGIPYAAKDLLAAKGYPTTWGARPYANQKLPSLRPPACSAKRNRSEFLFIGTWILMRWMISAF